MLTLVNVIEEEALEENTPYHYQLDVVAVVILLIEIFVYVGRSLLATKLFEVQFTVSTIFVFYNSLKMA